MDKIRLTKDGAIVFLGTMNAMPMAYAMDLRELGYEILYFVDVSKENALCRPESHYPEIKYPYPPWIIEFPIPSQLLLALFPRSCALLYRLIAKFFTKKPIQCYFLNGFFVSLSPFLQNKAIKVGLSHGSDLDVWADVENTEKLAKAFADRSVFKYIPSFLSALLIKKIVSRQFFGYSRSDLTLYFPLEFNKEGRRVVESIVKCGGNYAKRYDASFRQLIGNFKNYKTDSRPLKIISIVRFMYRTFPEGNSGYNKGNDSIIKGIAKFRAEVPNIVVHFVEKGEDVRYAKELCAELGLDDVIVWHKEMPFQTLVDNILDCDVCIDQVGDNFIGAGLYAMYLGLPLIANADPAIRAGIWPDDNPVLNSKNADDICAALTKLSSPCVRRTVGLRSRDFVVKYLATEKTLRSIFEFD